MVENKIFNMVSGQEAGISFESAASEIFNITSGPQDLFSSIISELIEQDGRFLITDDQKIKLSDSGIFYKELIEETYIVIDTETTGTRTYHDKMTEIAAFKVVNGEIIDQYETLINPGRYIPYDITKITGITNDMVKDAPQVEEVLEKFLEFLGDSVFVAQNAPFDHRFISAALDEAGFDPLPNRVLCTVKMSRKLYPQHKRHNLDELMKRFGFENLSRHRAAGDAKVTANILIEMINNLPQSKIFHLEELLSK